MQKITLIAACSQNGCIGINNTIPWYLPEDFAFFRAYTLNKSVIMGRKTWESLPKKPLPQRRNIVITRQIGYTAEGAETVTGLHDALAACIGEAEVIIMGGAQIYTASMPSATDLRITEVALNVAGDAFFPIINRNLWLEKDRKTHTAANGINYALVHYERAKLPPEAV